MSPAEEQSRQLADVFRATDRIVIFTGAGISTESGIPDFRSPGGVWTKYKPVMFQEFLDSEDARKRYWVYKKEGFPDFAAAAPNAGHQAIVELEKRGKLQALITQNIDGLHEVAGSSTDLIFELHGTERWVDCLRQRPKDRPFFMWFASYDAHRAWAPDKEAKPHTPEDAVIPPYLIDTADVRKDLAQYYDEVQRLDRYTGEVVRELKTQGVLENTCIIFMADNGRPFPRCKTRLYDSGSKTPLAETGGTDVAAGIAPDTTAELVLPVLPPLLRVHFLQLEDIRLALYRLSH